MDEDQSAEETTFVVDEITTVIKVAVESTIGNSSFQHSKINLWMSNIVESSLSQLTKLGKPFKYIVTCIVLQKMGQVCTLPAHVSGTTLQMEAAQYAGRIKPYTA